jgi:hypothetical protein
LHPDPVRSSHAATRARAIDDGELLPGSTVGVDASTDAGCVAGSMGGGGGASLLWAHVRLCQLQLRLGRRGAALQEVARIGERTPCLQRL